MGRRRGAGAVGGGVKAIEGVGGNGGGEEELVVAEEAGGAGVEVFEEAEAAEGVEGDEGEGEADEEGGEAEEAGEEGDDGEDGGEPGVAGGDALGAAELFGLLVARVSWARCSGVSGEAVARGGAGEAAGMTGGGVGTRAGCWRSIAVISRISDVWGWGLGTAGRVLSA